MRRRGCRLRSTDPTIAQADPAEPPTRPQLLRLAVCVGTPMVGFGFDSDGEPASGSGMDYAFLRVLLRRQAGDTVTALVDATVVFSHQ